MTPTDAEFIARHIDEASDEHYAVMFTPPARRLATAAVFGLHRVMRDLTALSPEVVSTKVTWWHEEIERMRQGAGVHPLSAALSAHAGDHVADALNDLLHGAIMDLNEVEVGADDLDRYLWLHSGALHAALGALADAPVDEAHRSTLGRLQAIPVILREARDPRFADRRTAQLRLSGVTDDAGLEMALRAEFDNAEGRRSVAAPVVTGAVYLELAGRALPAIVDTPWGAIPAELPPWRKLWAAWRAARRHHRQGAGE